MMEETKRNRERLSTPNESLPRIYVSNSFCKLKGFPRPALKKVKKLLTYENEGAQLEIIQKVRLLKMAQSQNNMRMAYAMRAQIKALEDGRIVCWLDTSGKYPTFPTGHLSIVRKLLKKLGVEHKLRDRRVVPEHSPIMRWYNKPHEMRYYQEDMVGLGKENTRGVFESAVGSGKSLIMLYLTKEIQVNTLLVVPSRPLMEQLYYDFAIAFGTKNVKRVNSQVLKGKAKLPPIRIVTIQTMAALQRSGKLSLLLADVGMLLMDEFHHAGSKSYTDLLPELDHVFWRFGFTGTFLRNDHKTLDMLGFLSNRLYHYPPKQAIDDGYLVQPYVRMYKLPGKPSKDYQREYTLNYCGTGGILEAITDIVDNIPKDEQVLILVDRKDKAGKIIHGFLKEQGFDNTYVSGDDKKEFVTAAIDNFNKKKIRILVGSTVIGEGIDVHSTQHLILATGGKSVVKIVQAVGRCVRLHPGKDCSFVYDFMFEGTNYMGKHAKQRIKIYQDQFNAEVEWR